MKTRLITLTVTLAALAAYLAPLAAAGGRWRITPVARAVQALRRAATRLPHAAVAAQSCRVFSL